MSKSSIVKGGKCTTVFTNDLFPDMFGNYKETQVCDAGDDFVDIITKQKNVLRQDTIASTTQHINPKAMMQNRFMDSMLGGGFGDSMLSGGFGGGDFGKYMLMDRITNGNNSDSYADMATLQLLGDGGRNINKKNNHGRGCICPECSSSNSNNNNNGHGTGCKCPECGTSSVNSKRPILGDF